MKLGKNEKLLREWEYYKSSQSHVGTLVVTDKRVLNISEDRYGKTHKELRVKDITAIESGYERTGHLFWGIVFLLLGLICFALPFILEAEDKTFYIIAAAVLIVIAILLLCKKEMQFFLNITTNQLAGVGLGLYVTSNGFDVNKKKNRKKSNKIKIKINSPNALDIVNEFGGLIWSLQALNEELARSTPAPAPAPAQNDDEE